MKKVLLLLMVFALVFLCACNPSNPTDTNPTFDNATTEQSGDPTVDATQGATGNSTEDTTGDAAADTTVDTTVEGQETTEATTEQDWEFPIDVDDTFLENNTTVGESDDDFELPIDLDVPDTTVDTQNKPTEPTQGSVEGTTDPEESVETTEKAEEPQDIFRPGDGAPIELPLIPG